MDQRGEFARARERTQVIIDAHAPRSVPETLKSLLRPCIALKLHPVRERALLRDASKFGGDPAVPEGFQWPEIKGKPLNFLAQVNLAVMAPFDTDELLPANGLLLFFITPDQDDGMVIHVEGPRLERARKPEVKQSFWSFLSTPQMELKPAAIEFVPSWSIPSDTQTYPEIAAPAGEGGESESFQVEFPWGGHQMFGYGFAIQNAPEAEAERLRQEKEFGSAEQQIVTAERENWVLLLQVDSDKQLNVMWGDIGMLYFMIRKDHLTARRWGETRCIMIGH